jgi:DNA polymerase-3 subunit alpha
LNQIFTANKGDNTVTFEIIEQEKVEKIVEAVPKIGVEDDANLETENMEDVVVEIPTVEEEIQVITKVTLPSRKLKIKISTELLQELEKMGLNFKLN